MNIDLTAPEIKQNPYPVYSRLREELPICKAGIGKHESAWLITCHSDERCGVICAVGS